MKENMIRVLKIEPEQAPAVKEIQNDLASLQAEVGGLIECISFPNGCVVVCNEEGKLRGMQPNRRLGADIIYIRFLSATPPTTEISPLSAK